MADIEDTLMTNIVVIQTDGTIKMLQEIEGTLKCRLLLRWERLVKWFFFVVNYIR